MSYTKVDICNLALRKVNGKRISSIDDDSKEGRLCKENYPIARDNALIAFPWPFALKRQELSQVEIENLTEYTYAYQLPEAPLMLHLVEFFSIDDGSIITTGFLLEGSYLFTDEESIGVKYISQFDTVASFSIPFVKAVALNLATIIAFPITGEIGIEEKKIREYDNAIVDASANENTNRARKPEQSVQKWEDGEY